MPHSIGDCALHYETHGRRSRSYWCRGSAASGRALQADPGACQALPRDRARPPRLRPERPAAYALLGRVDDAGHTAPDGRARDRTRPFSRAIRPAAIGQIIAFEQPQRLTDEVVLSSTWTHCDAFFTRSSRRGTPLKHTGPHGHQRATSAVLYPAWWVAQNEALVAEQERQQAPSSRRWSGALAHRGHHALRPAQRAPASARPPWSRRPATTW